VCFDTFPIKYLGFLLHYEKLGKEDVQPLIDKILKRIVAREVSFSLMLPT
jgi:hypothetical protein